MGRRKKFSIKRIEKALRECYGYQTHAAKLLGCTYETVRNYMLDSEYLRDILKEISETTNDDAEYIWISGLKLAKKKAEIINKALEDEATNDKEILELSVDRDGSFISEKHLKMKAKDRGYVERQELTGADGEAFGVIVLPEKKK